jgi:ribosomal protein L11 methyltransferase
MELMEAVFGEPPSSYTDVKSGTTKLTLYFRERPPAGRFLRRDLAAGLARIADCGLSVKPGNISCARVPAEDWAQSWKRHFKPLEIGSALLIKPTWSRRRPKKGQKLVTLDPGLSFGTGRHPTTGFCLRQLAARRKTLEKQSFLDIGTGSGILAIAAAKLGYLPVCAFDHDPEAVRIARSNARKNGVEKKITFSEQDVTKLPRRGATKYSLICANLVSNLLLQTSEIIAARLSAEATLIIAGILTEEFERVRTAYEAGGLRLVAGRSEKEWRSGAFKWH